ncbi:MAG: SagB family peptide dehydrogenase [Candidatus Kariarchaeaceae archaeon]
MNLPAPQRSSDVLLDDVLGFTEPTRQPSISTQISLTEVTQLVWAAQGISHIPFRTVPSAGATYPLDIFVSLKDTLDGLSASSYRYIPVDHTLKQWSENNLFSDLNQIIPNGTTVNFLSSAQILFSITAVFERTTEKYGSRGIQYVHLETGHLLQNLQIQAKALNIHLEMIYDFNTIAFQSALETNYHPQALVFAWKLEDPDQVLNLASVSSTVSVEEAIDNRKSIRDYQSKAIKRAELTNLIDFSYYKTNQWTGSQVFGSITGVFPVNLYLSITNVDGIDSGVYKYDPFVQRFFQLSNSSNRNELYEQSLRQIWVLDAPVVLVWAINETQLLRSSYPQSLQSPLSLYEVGTIAQNIYLKSYTLGLGTVVVGAFSESGIRSAILAGQDEKLFYVQPIGKVASVIFGDFSSFSAEWWDSLFGWLSIGFFYFSCLFFTPPFKKALKGWAKWLHLLLGFFSVIFAVLHLILNHGGWYLVSRPSWNRVKVFVETVWFYFPLSDDLPLNDLGLVLARIIVWLTTTFIILSLLNFFNVLKGKWYKYLKSIHKYVGYTIATGILLHAIINGYWFDYLGSWSYVILIVTLGGYLTSKYYYQIRRFYKKSRNNRIKLEDHK